MLQPDEKKPLRRGTREIGWTLNQIGSSRAATKPRSTSHPRSRSVSARLNPPPDVRDDRCGVCPRESYADGARPAIDHRASRVRCVDHDGGARPPDAAPFITRIAPISQSFFRRHGRGLGLALVAVLATLAAPSIVDAAPRSNTKASRANATEPANDQPTPRAAEPARDEAGSNAGANAGSNAGANESTTAEQPQTAAPAHAPARTRTPAGKPPREPASSAASDASQPLLLALRTGSRHAAADGGSRAAAANAAPPADDGTSAGSSRNSSRTGSAGDGGGKKKISLDDFLVEGKLEKPSAYYILRRSQLEHDWARLDARFSPLVLESVQDPLF